jgi:hypothetical protein
VPRKVVLVSSGLGRRAMAGSASYCAAKAGLDHLARAVALEEAARPNGARIVSLAPGVIDTDMQLQLRSADAAAFPERERFAGLHSGGQLDSPARPPPSCCATWTAPTSATTRSPMYATPEQGHAMTNEPLVLVDRDTAGLAVLTLNRPQAMNALNKALMPSWPTPSTPGCRPGGAGADPHRRRPRLLRRAGPEGNRFRPGQPGRRDGAPRGDPVAAIGRYPGPVIGAINGAAVTGGFELALACDVLLASPGALCRHPCPHRHRAGLGPEPEAQPRHRRLPGARGVVHRQLGDGRAGGGLGLRQPRGAGRRPAARRAISWPPTCWARCPTC